MRNFKFIIRLKIPIQQINVSLTQLITDTNLEIDKANGMI